MNASEYLRELENFIWVSSWVPKPVKVTQRGLRLPRPRSPDFLSDESGGGAKALQFFILLGDPLSITSARIALQGSPASCSA